MSAGLSERRAYELCLTLTRSNTLERRETKKVYNRLVVRPDLPRSTPRAEELLYQRVERGDVLKLPSESLYPNVAFVDSAGRRKTVYMQQDHPRRRRFQQEKVAKPLPTQCELSVEKFLSDGRGQGTPKMLCARRALCLPIPEENLKVSESRGRITDTSMRTSSDGTSLALIDTPVRKNPGEPVVMSRNSSMSQLKEMSSSNSTASRCSKPGKKTSSIELTMSSARMIQAPRPQPLRSSIESRMTQSIQSSRERLRSSFIRRPSVIIPPGVVSLSDSVTRIATCAVMSASMAPDKPPTVTVLGDSIVLAIGSKRPTRVRKVRDIIGDGPVNTRTATTNEIQAFSNRIAAESKIEKHPLAIFAEEHEAALPDEIFFYRGVEKDERRRVWVDAARRAIPACLQGVAFGLWMQDKTQKRVTLWVDHMIDNVILQGPNKDISFALPQFKLAIGYPDILTSPALAEGLQRNGILEHEDVLPLCFVLEFVSNGRNDRLFCIADNEEDLESVLVALPLLSRFVLVTKSDKQ